MAIKFKKNWKIEFPIAFNYFKILMPLSIKIVENNGQILNKPKYVNYNPLDDNWMVKIEIEAMKETENLIITKQYPQLKN